MLRMSSSTSKNRKTRVIGIDPGYGRLGIAVIETGGGEDKLLFSDCLETAASLPFEKRLLRLAEAFEKWHKQYQPQILAIEKLFFSVNRKTALQVAAVRGLFLFLAAKYGLTIIELAPTEIKMMISGYGRADKKQMTAIIQKLFVPPKNSRKKYDDEFDAIGIALCGCLKRKMLSTF